MESKSKDSEICLTEISEDNPGNDEEGVFKKAKLIIIQDWRKSEAFRLEGHCKFQAV